MDACASADGACFQPACPVTSANWRLLPLKCCLKVEFKVVALHPVCFVFQRCSEHGHPGVVGAPHGSWAGFKCRLHRLPGSCAALSMWSRLLPVEGGRVHSQVTCQGGLPVLAALCAPSFLLPAPFLSSCCPAFPALDVRPIPGRPLVSCTFTICFS